MDRLSHILKSNEQYAYFSLVGEFDPEMVSLRVGLAPSRAWRKGEVNPKTQLERRTGRWCLDSRLDRIRPLEEHVRDVLQQMSANVPAFAEVAQQFGGVLQLVGYFYASYPGFGLDKGTVQNLASFGLEIDCDFYFLYSEEQEAPEPETAR